jgi:hypothetical protein
MLYCLYSLLTTQRSTFSMFVNLEARNFDLLWPPTLQFNKIISTFRDWCRRIRTGQSGCWIVFSYSPAIMQIHWIQWNSVIRWVTWNAFVLYQSVVQFVFCATVRMHPQIPAAALFYCLQISVENDLPAILGQWDSPSIVSNIFSKIFLYFIKTKFPRSLYALNYILFYVWYIVCSWNHTEIVKTGYWFRCWWFRCSCFSEFVILMFVISEVRDFYASQLFKGTDSLLYFYHWYLC